jgi:hypothetical protein
VSSGDEFLESGRADLVGRDGSCAGLDSRGLKAAASLSRKSRCRRSSRVCQRPTSSSIPVVHARGVVGVVSEGPALSVRLVVAASVSTVRRPYTCQPRRGPHRGAYSRERLAFETRDPRDSASVRGPSLSLGWGATIAASCSLVIVEEDRRGLEVATHEVVDLRAGLLSRPSPNHRGGARPRAVRGGSTELGVSPSTFGEGPLSPCSDLLAL